MFFRAEAFHSEQQCTENIIEEEKSINETSLRQIFQWFIMLSINLPLLNGMYK